MRIRLILNIAALFFSFSALGQGEMDLDFKIKKKWGDICFKKTEYSLAIQNYNIALAINPACEECKEQITKAKSILRSKLKESMESLEEKKNYKQEIKKEVHLSPIISKYVSIIPSTGDSAYLGVSKFEISQYEVSQREWRVYCQMTGNAFPEIPLKLTGEKFPIVRISWQEAKDYAEWLSLETGGGYDLPTLLEWELTKSTISSLKEGAWLYENSERSLHNVGTKEANVNKVYDMEGNASEWVSDWYGKEYLENSNLDGLFEENESFKQRIVCGCSFKDETSFCKNGYFRALDSELTKDFIGFRLVKRTL